MTETARAEPAVISAETPSIKERIVKRKNVIFEAVVDPELIKVACEKLKQQLFAKFAFIWFQPKLEEIQFVSLEKYYEPYIVISGKYFINYLRKSNYTLEVPEGVRSGERDREGTHGEEQSQEQGERDESGSHGTPPSKWRFRDHTTQGCNQAHERIVFKGATNILEETLAH